MLGQSDMNLCGESSYVHGGFGEPCARPLLVQREGSAVPPDDHERQVRTDVVPCRRGAVCTGWRSR